MKFTIKKSSLDVIAKSLSHTFETSSVHSYRNTSKDDPCVIELISFSKDDLTSLSSELTKCEEVYAVRAIKNLLNSILDPENKKCKDLRSLPDMFREFFKTRDTWLFSSDENEKGIAYCFVSATLNHYSNRGYKESAYVQLELAYNSKNVFSTRQITLDKEAIGFTIVEMLLAKRLRLSDEDLLDAYEKSNSKFELFRSKHAEQFWVRKIARQYGSRFWWDGTDQDLSINGKPTKAVIDTNLSQKEEDNWNVKNYVSSTFLGRPKLPVPMHPIVKVFSLAFHEYYWVLVQNMKQYEYEENISSKLVLPESHSTLIGALVKNLDVLKNEDESTSKSRLIRNKAKSSILLCKGPPGTGKTLTAEVYAETIKRPLYEIAGGQLGSSPEDIEENLNVILNRSTALKMPLLINEADVFIKSRKDDFVQNAVVSIFLRLLEYHNGLVFLTTNRSEDIDDAILSRCIAEISYDNLTLEQRTKIWPLTLAEFNVTLPKEDLQKAIDGFDKVSGRDILNLVRLTNRVCEATNQKFSFKALKDNAVFKSIKFSTKKD